MRSLVVIFMLLCSSALCLAQYRGGKDDGFQELIANVQNVMPAIYRGGNDDGFNSRLVTSQNGFPSIYMGGNDDGFSGSRVLAQNTFPSIYTGGINDGFDHTVQFIQNALPNIYNGGVNDGFNLNVSLQQNALPSIYTGGANDGWAFISSSGIPVSVVYVFDGTGNWDIPSNWVNNLIPPSPLPAGSEIMINPNIGDCILNVSQVVSPGARITIVAGKRLVIPGYIQ